MTTFDLHLVIPTWLVITLGSLLIVSTLMSMVRSWLNISLMRLKARERS